MKKIVFILFVLMLMILSACSNNTSEDKKSNKQAKEETVDVKKGLVNVEITVPASMLEGQDIDTVIANAKKEGVSEVTKNKDGSLTYKMTKAKHKEMMEELRKSILETIKETKNSKDYASIKDITHNDSFSEFTLIVDKAKYENSMDGFAAIGLGMTGMMYQIYNGSDSDAKVKIFIKDEATQKVFDETVYPDDLDQEPAE